MNVSEDKIQELASVQHEIWAHWMKYMCTQAIPEEQGYETGNITFSKAIMDRWMKQANTPYSELTEREQASDINQVMKFIHLI